MLLQSNLDENTFLMVEVESTGNFAKGEGEDSPFHPDAILANVVRAATLVATKLSEAAQAASQDSVAPPARLKLSFGLKVDGGSVVSLASDASAAHFRVEAEWSPRARS